MARALAELHVLHPRLPIVFAGNRKLANAWTAPFVRAAHRAAALAVGYAFGLEELRERLPEVASARLRRVLDQLVAEGQLIVMGQGRGR